MHLLIKNDMTMKKIAIATLLAFAALSAGAQTIGDALQFSEYN